MKLRRRTLTLALASLFGAATFSSFAQGKVVKEGADYQLLKPRQPADNKQIELIEFFWYGCPHCNVLEHPFQAWLKKQTSDVTFRRVHINFGAGTDAHQKLFLTLEQMGEIPNHHAAVFTAIHGENKRLNNDNAVFDWVKTRGLDVEKFKGVYNSFSMSAKVNQAKQLQTTFKVEGVPFFAIDGQYLTSQSIVGGTLDSFFASMEGILQKVRNDRKANNAAATPAKPVKK